MLLGLFLLLGVVGLSVLLPQVGLLVCGALLLVQVGVIAVRIAAALSKPAALPVPPISARPVFSVHVATHNEPPDMVIATLSALAGQEWSEQDFEVIVIDNNTDDPALWQAVQAYCAARGPAFRFFHRDNVQGAKAGALNIALSHTRADATHVITVDADYAVIPRFLDAACEALARTGADYVQFPQAYALSAQGARGVDAELKEYFLTTAQMADGSEAVLLTGTLCVISRSALKACGGWSGVTTTEDAELGVRLCSAGYSGRFISQVVGQGLLPFSLPDLQKQRYRWASGNLQTLLRHAPGLLSGSSRLGFGKRMAVVSQLTAWLNFALLPSAVLLLALVLNQSTALVMLLAAATIICSFADLAWRLVLRGIRDRMSPSLVLGALASRVALAPVSAQATMDALLGRKLGFVVTNKSHDAPRREATLPVANLLLALLSLLVFPAALQAGPVIAAAVLILALPLPAAAFTANRLRGYRGAVSALRQRNAA